jgi:D-3-phosphoglycerate dehydrogenase / 2-oxoglutarate reductase
MGTPTIRAKMNPTVFVTAPHLAKEGLALLESANARVLFLEQPDDVAGLESTLATHPVDAVISRTVNLSARAIAACPTLKVISKHGVGVSNIDVQAATVRGIPVFVTPGANAASVAELTLALMLAAARKVGSMDRSLRAGCWRREQDGIELRGRTLGLVGFGQVGRRVARLALALDMVVHAFDPAVQTDAGGMPGVTFHDQLESLLPRSHVLSLHAPLNDRTRAMLGAGQIRALPRGALVVNTARGELIDEMALVAALQDGHLYGAGLDTMACEPLPAGHPLTALDNVVLTPHVGGSTPAALSAMAIGAARNVLGWMNGAPPDASACVNPAVLETAVSRIR